MAGGCQLHKDTENKFKRTGDTANWRYGAEQLILGQVDFINCLPINLPVELGMVNVNTNIVNGVPSELNKMILQGEIDIAPVSSITYLENKDKLIPISDLCIASNGPCDSVLLFSRFPIEELGNVNIALSSASATSNVLLEIIFKEFLKLNCIFTIETHGHASLRLNKCPAYLLIGDHALREFSKMPRNIFIYDLGSLWKKYTGLPMVFGIWVARKEIVGAGHDLPFLAKQLQNAKEIGLGSMFDIVIKKAQEKVLLSKDFYNTYFQHLSYEFTDEYKRGLEVFEELTSRTKMTFAM